MSSNPGTDGSRELPPPLNFDRGENCSANGLLSLKPCEGRARRGIVWASPGVLVPCVRGRARGERERRAALEDTRFASCV